MALWSRANKGWRTSLNQIVCCANYSRNAKNNSDSPYKVVKARVKLEDESGRLGSEGSLNWELFSAKGNRFFLPGSSGPAWHSNSTTIYADVILDDLIDYESKQTDKLHISCKECPQLLRGSLHELFPAPEVVAPSRLTMIELAYNKDLEAGAKIFILAAREICSRLRLSGYWADFMNPFSGKPFHSYASGKNLYKLDERFRGLGMKLESFNNCLLISEEDRLPFSGNIFTNAPPDLVLIQSMLQEE